MASNGNKKQVPYKTEIIAGVAVVTQTQVFYNKIFWPVLEIAQMSMPHQKHNIRDTSK